MRRIRELSGPFAHVRQPFRLLVTRRDARSSTRRYLPVGLHGLMIARIEKAFVLGSSTAARPSASAARSYSLYLKARQESPSRGLPRHSVVPLWAANAARDLLSARARDRAVAAQG